MHATRQKYNGVEPKAILNYNFHGVLNIDIIHEYHLLDHKIM